MELIKWLFFRIMFQSGYGKILSGCPAWKNLEAMRTHFQSQPIPHIGAWHAHHSISLLGKDIMSALTIYLETFIPLMIYMPFRYFRRMSYILQALLMICTIATGNFNFINMLTVTVGLATLDDEALQRVMPSWLISMLGLKLDINESEHTPAEIDQKGKNSGTPMHFGIFSCDVLSILGFWGLNGFAFYQLFLVQTKEGSWDVNREHQDFFKSVNTAGNLNTLLIWILITALISIYQAFNRMNNQRSSAILRNNRQTNNGPSYIFSIFGLVVFVFLYMLSLPNFGASMGHKPQSVTLLKGTSDHILELQGKIAGLKLVNSYGLFRKMTGLEGTPVIILEGLMKPKGNTKDSSKWMEIEIEGKLGDLKTMPGIYNPCQRRVPWQMWFTALEEKILSPHFLNLLFKIGMKKESYRGMIKVRDDAQSGKLVDLKDFNISEIRVSRYLYSFADKESLETKGAYWKRKVDDTFQELAIPQVELFKFEKYLDGIGVLVQGAEQPEAHPYASYFDWLSFC